MSELKLKSETKSYGTVVSVRTIESVQFLGVNGQQLSSSMAGIHLTWNGDVVVVTSDSYPGESRWLFPANISDIRWKTE